jgi:hypothetical protein
MSARSRSSPWWGPRRQQVNIATLDLEMSLAVCDTNWVERKTPKLTVSASGWLRPSGETASILVHPSDVPSPERPSR